MPTDSDPIEIPWDVIRSRTDAAFEQHLTDREAASARIVGARVGELRDRLHLTGRDLAARAGITPERLAAIEAGTDGVSLPVLEHLAAVMGHDLRIFVVDAANDHGVPNLADE